MKAMIFHEYGEPSVLRLEEISKPAPGPSQVLIEVKAAGVNFADCLQRRNLYPMQQELPIVLGFEAAGLVESVGSAVKHLKKGDRVIALPSGGAYSQFALAEAAMTFAIPDTVSFEIAAALPGQAITVVYMLEEAQLKPGQTVAVTAAAGGVGAVAAQIAKLKGAAKAYGITGSAAKVAGLKEFGYDSGFSADKADWTDQLLKATDGKGVDIYLDSVGGEMFTAGLKVLGMHGTAVTFGRASGKAPNLDPMVLMAKNQSVRGFSLRSYLGNPDALKKALEFLLKAYGDGKLKIGVESYPLKDAAKVHENMENRKTTGKLVLVP